VQRSLNMLLVDFDVVWSVLFSALRSMWIQEGYLEKSRHNADYSIQKNCGKADQMTDESTSDGKLWNCEDMKTTMFLRIAVDLVDEKCFLRRIGWFPWEVRSCFHSVIQILPMDLNVAMWNEKWDSKGTDPSFPHTSSGIESCGRRR
jgi:hypothetical protein